MSTSEDTFMPYEMYTRTTVRVEEPALSLVPDGRIALNAAAVRILTQAGVKSVVLLWDKTNNRVALKAAAKGDKNSYAVSIVRNSHSGSLRAKSFLTHIGCNVPKRTMLPATWIEKEKMLEISVPREYLASKPAASPHQKAKTAS
jgi:hypothetical protein